MDGTHWSAWDLDDIVGCVLQWLSPTALLKARLVCRRWNRIILSQRSKITTPCCYFYKRDPYGLGRHEEKCGQLFDPCISSWTKVSCPRLSAPDFEAHFLQVGSSGSCGLVALCERVRYTQTSSVPNFWVGNPLRNEWKFIPGSVEFVRHDRFGILSMSSCHFLVTEGPPVSYKIVALLQYLRSLDMTGSGVKVLTYSSVTRDWSLGARSPQLALWGIADTVVQDECIYYVSRPRMGCSSTRIVRYSLEHDRFDVIAEGADWGMPGGGIILEDNQVPVVYTVYEDHKHRVNINFYEFERNEEGWRLKETSKYDFLKEGLPAYGDYCIRFSGNAEQIYAFAEDIHSLFPVGLFKFDSDAAMFVHQPFSSNQEELRSGLVAHNMCSFIPRFDVCP